MANHAPPNVWSQMDYVPPRGQCNFRQSLLSTKCPCLRFMLHPLKSSSSYECDGCGHHASFHNMENKVEDEIRKRWEQEASEKAQRDQDASKPPRKRMREIEYTTGGAGGAAARITERVSGAWTLDDDTSSELGTSRTRGAAKGKGRKVTVGRTRNKKTSEQGRAEIEEEEDGVIDVD